MAYILTAVAFLVKDRLSNSFALISIPIGIAIGGEFRRKFTLGRTNSLRVPFQARCDFDRAKLTKP